MLVVFFTMLLAGCVGGVGAAMLRNLRFWPEAGGLDAPPVKADLRKIFECVALGIIAAFIVPLLLDWFTIGQSGTGLVSELVDTGDDAPKPKLFLLAGLCILAGLSAPTLLKNAAAQFEGLARQVGQVEQTTRFLGAQDQLYGYYNSGEQALLSGQGLREVFECSPGNGNLKEKAEALYNRADECFNLVLKFDSKSVVSDTFHSKNSWLRSSGGSGCSGVSVSS